VPRYAAPVRFTPMKRNLLLPALAGVALMSVACAKEPTDTVGAAKASLEAAKTAGAADYAPAALASAETSAAALDAELKAQSEKFALTRSYTKATELAATAKADAEKAAAEAVTGKEQMKAEATTLIAGVRGSLDAAKQALAKAPKGKGSAADIEAMNADVAGVESSLTAMDSAMAAGNYKDAKVKAEAAKQTLDKIVADVQAATLAKKGKR
jgi:colicin import membrane protein